MAAPKFRAKPEVVLSWHQEAACAGLDPAMFTPEVDATGPRGNIQAAINKARAVCWTCPVRRVCLDDAFATGDAWTIRGGMTAEERRRLRRLEAQEAEALAAGEPPPVLNLSVRARYEAGMPCARGHELTEQTVKVRGGCVECRPCAAEVEAERRGRLLTTAGAS